jgi:hypothetical protein
MAPNAEEELLVVKPWGPQPEKVQRKRDREREREKERSACQVDSQVSPSENETASEQLCRVSRDPPACKSR